MADSNIKPYPFMFDPSQWANKFSPLQGKPIPFPSGFVGTPTDALGNPIQSYLDAQTAHDAWTPPPQPMAPQSMAPATTLNSAPTSGLSGTWPVNSGGGANPSWASSAQNPAMQARMNPGPGAYYSQGASNSLGGNQYDSARIPMTPFAQAPVGPQGPQQAAPAAAAPTNPVDMNAAYMAALANPGKVTTPGATVPQSAPPSNQSGVLQQFLANWQNKGSPTTGAGNYNNAGFFNALRGQV